MPWYVNWPEYGTSLSKEEKTKIFNRTLTEGDVKAINERLGGEAIIFSDEPYPEIPEESFLERLRHEWATTPFMHKINMVGLLLIVFNIFVIFILPLLMK